MSFDQEMSYEDGASPPPDVIDRWLALVDAVFYKAPPSSSSSNSSNSSINNNNPASRRSSAASISSSSSAAAAAAAALQCTDLTPHTIAVHCVAGLGRAPVLVALALIEHGFGDPSAAVEFIRSQRRGAINMRQLNYLEQVSESGSTFD